MEKVRREQMQLREKVEKSRNTVFFQCFVAPEGRKVGSLERRVRRHLGRVEMKTCTPLWCETHLELNSAKHIRLGRLLEVEMWKKCTPLWREAHFEVRSVKTPGVRTPFGRCDVEKVHTVVARSTFRSKKWQNSTMLGPLLDVAMSKTCTPLWREAYLEVKSFKTFGIRTTF